jgi:hypothetical protein
LFGDQVSMLWLTETGVLIFINVRGFMTDPVK